MNGETVIERLLFHFVFSGISRLIKKNFGRNKNDMETCWVDGICFFFKYYIVFLINILAILFFQNFLFYSNGKIVEIACNNNVVMGTANNVFYQ